MKEFEHNPAALTSFPKLDIWAQEANTTAIFGKHTHRTKRILAQIFRIHYFYCSPGIHAYLHDYSNDYHFAKFLNSRYILKEHGMSFSSTDGLLIFLYRIQKMKHFEEYSILRLSWRKNNYSCEDMCHQTLFTKSCTCWSTLICVYKRCLLYMHFIFLNVWWVVSNFHVILNAFRRQTYLLFDECQTQASNSWRRLHLQLMELWQV